MGGVFPPDLAGLVAGNTECQSGTDFSVDVPHFPLGGFCWEEL